MKYALVLILIAPTLFGAAAIRPQQLRSEYRANPQGIDVTDPRLSWLLAARTPKRGVSARRLPRHRRLQRTRPRRRHGDLWDTGKVQSDSPLTWFIAANLSFPASPPSGKCRSGPGRPRQRLERAAEWSMGLLHPQDWRAKWIAATNRRRHGRTRLAARLLRKEFQAEKKVRRATVYYSGLGLSELYLNGAKVGDHVLSPVLPITTSTFST